MLAAVVVKMALTWEFMELLMRMNRLDRGDGVTKIRGERVSDSDKVQFLYTHPTLLFAHYTITIATPF